MQYTPDGKGDVLNILVHQNFRLSKIATDILDSHNLRTVFSILGCVRTLEAADAVENLTDWELFQSFDTELTSPNIQIHTSHVAHKEACSLYRNGIIYIYNFRQEILI